MPYNLPIKHIIRPEILECPPHTPILEAARLMSEANCSSILVSDKGKIIGIWTERDALAADFSDPSIFSQPVSSVMSFPVMALHYKSTIGEAAQHFVEKGVRHFLVINDDEKHLGIITQTDVIRNSGIELSIRLKTLRSLVRHVPLVIPSGTLLSAAIKKMNDVRHDAVVVDFGDELGILTGRDVIRMIGNGRADLRIAEIASRPLICMEENASLHHVLNIFTEKGVRHLGVSGGEGKLTGVVSYADILANIEHDYVEELRQALKDYEYKLDIADHHLLVAKNVFETADEAITITDADAIIQSVNPAFTKITGFEPAEVIGKKSSVLKSGRHGPEFYQKMWDALRTDGYWQGEIWDKRKNGEIYLKWLTISAVRKAGGEITNYTATFSDVTEQKRAEEAIREGEQRYRVLFNSSNDAIFVHPMLPEGPGKFVEVNDVACQRMGYSREELLQLSPLDIDSTARLGDFPAIFEKLFAEKQALFSTEHVTKDGREIPVEVNVRLFELNGQPYGLSVVRDITERKLAEERIRHLAHYDALTNLPNRSLLLERLNITLSQAKRYNRQFAVLFMDLDGFKQINDTLGHDAGDDLLIGIADRLLQCVRAGDTVSRLGGDEFIILLSEIQQPEDASAIAEKIIHAARQQIVICGQNTSVTTSIGIAAYPSGGEDVTTLMKNADVAMYAVKEAGRDGWRFFPNQ